MSGEWKVKSKVVTVKEVRERVLLIGPSQFRFVREFVNDKCVDYHFAFGRAKYKYASEEFFKLLKTKPKVYWTNSDYFSIWEDLKDKELDVWNIERMIQLDRGSDLFFQYGKEAPMTYLHCYSYIGGIANNEYDLDKILDHLKGNPYVLKCEIEKIPYYNAEPEEGYTHGLSMWVLPPQDYVDKVWEACRNIKYNASILRDAVISRWKPEFDLLEINQFKKVCQLD